MQGKGDEKAQKDVGEGVCPLWCDRRTSLNASSLFDCEVFSEWKACWSEDQEPNDSGPEVPLPVVQTLSEELQRFKLLIHSVIQWSLERRAALIQLSHTSQEVINQHY